MMRRLLCALVLYAVTTMAFAGDLPNPLSTPGAVNEAIPADHYRQICHERHWTRLYRPPVGFTNKLKKLQMKQYGYADGDPRDYEEDHLIPLCLAGAPQDPHNLWPQPRFGEWDAAKKDKLETKLCRLTCSGKVGLKEAQRDIAKNWIATYKKYLGGAQR
jgi:hypothetical protein